MWVNKMKSDASFTHGIHVHQSYQDSPLWCHTALATECTDRYHIETDLHCKLETPNKTLIGMPQAR